VTKEEFLALGIQPNEVVLVNGDFVGFIRIGKWDELFEGYERHQDKIDSVEGLLQTHTIMGSAAIHWGWKEIESIKVIGRVENV
jgi:hypothetical protein